MRRTANILSQDVEIFVACTVHPMSMSGVLPAEPRGAARDGCTVPLVATYRAASRWMQKSRCESTSAGTTYSMHVYQWSSTLHSKAARSSLVRSELQVRAAKRYARLVSPVALVSLEALSSYRPAMADVAMNGVGAGEQAQAAAPAEQPARALWSALPVFSAAARSYGCWPPSETAMLEMSDLAAPSGTTHDAVFTVRLSA